jgi:hypothetical protein
MWKKSIIKPPTIDDLTSSVTPRLPSVIVVAASTRPTCHCVVTAAAQRRWRAAPPPLLPDMGQQAVAQEPELPAG